MSLQEFFGGGEFNLKLKQLKRTSVIRGWTFSPSWEDMRKESWAILVLSFPVCKWQSHVPSTLCPCLFSGLEHSHLMEMEEGLIQELCSSLNLPNLLSLWLYPSQPSLAEKVVFAFLSYTLSSARKVHLINNRVWLMGRIIWPGCL